MSRFIWAALACLLIVCEPLYAQTLTLTTADHPPFNMLDEATREPAGIAVDKVVELMRRAHQPYTITFYPWSRAYKLALQTEQTCVFSTSRTPERETSFTWIGPLVQSDWALFARANDARKPKVLEDVRPYVIGGYNDAATGEYLKQHGYTVQLAPDEALNLQKLMQNHIDFWATGELFGKHLIRKEGLTGQIVALFKFQQSPLYVACNRSMGPERAEAFNRILKDMDLDGTSAAIERKYQ
jgi:polar amino acid transport system substrate-binding protein